MKYYTLWRNKYLAIDAQDTAEFAAALQGAAETIARWRNHGVTLCLDGGVTDDYAQFVTEDVEFAKKEGFIPESEYFNGEEELDD